MYKIVSNGKDTLVKPGNVLKINFSIKIGSTDSVLQTSYGKSPLFIPVQTDVPADAYSPLEVFGMLHKGDSAKAKEGGGLSGQPLLPLATRMLAETYVRVEDAFPLIGAGGIDSGATAVQKMRAGASLLQLYSGLVFRGLGLVGEIKQALLAALEQDGRSRLDELVGNDAAAITAETWPA